MYKSLTFNQNALNNVYIETIVKRQQIYNFETEEIPLCRKYLSIIICIVNLPLFL